MKSRAQNSSFLLLLTLVLTLHLSQDEKLSSVFGMKGFTSKLTCSYDGSETPISLEFFTGDATTLGNPWSQVAGDRFTFTGLVKEPNQNSWKNVLSIAGKGLVKELNKNSWKIYSIS